MIAFSFTSIDDLQLLLVFFLFAAASAFIGGKISLNCEKEFHWGFWWGLFLGPIGWIIAAFTDPPGFEKARKIGAIRREQFRLARETPKKDKKKKKRPGDLPEPAPEVKMIECGACGFSAPASKWTRQITFWVCPSCGAKNEG